MTEQAASPVPDEQPASPVPVPSGERDERDWEERRRVAVEAWKLGQRLAASRSSQTAAASRKAVTTRQSRRRRTAAR